jgi:signal transduction histidine kinase
MAREQGRPGRLPVATDAVIGSVERELSGSVGAASAHAMVGRIAGGDRIGIPELIDIADETQRLIETSRQLAEKSAELERAAGALRNANDRLRTLDAKKDEFLSQISHELRTPMTSIRSFSEILMSDEPVPAPDRRRFVAIIHDESQRLTRLLDEILDISRLEAGTLDFAVGPIDPGRAIAAAVETVAGLAAKKGIAIRHEPAPEGVAVTANEDRLRQVLINLLSNAMKYNGAPRPEILVRPSLGQGRLSIDVIDNGGGVGREEAGLVFERFERGRAASGDGAGLGLAISRALMRRMGGDLTVRFTPVETSYFRISLALE